MGSRETVLDHLMELRMRIIKVIAFFAVFSVIAFFFSSRVMKFLSDSLFLKDFGVELIVTHPVEFFYTEINIAIFIGFVLTIPFIIYQVYAFIRPALERRERRAIKFSLPFFLGLFILGVCFAYFILLKVVIWFFSNLATSAEISNLWSIGNFISFIFFICIVLGFVFQLPAFSVLLVKLKVIDVEFLKKKRGYVIVAIFILAALITPPDPVTQVLVAVPMIVLYEASILVARALG